MSFESLVVLAALALVVVLQIIALLRRSGGEKPDALSRLQAQVQVQLQALEHSAQATQLAIARSDGALEGMGQQLRGLTQTQQAGADTLRQALEQRVERLQATLGEALAGFRSELTATTAALTGESTRSRQAMADSGALFEQRIQQRFEALAEATRGTLDSLKGDVQNQLTSMSTALRDQLEGNGHQIRNQFGVLQDAVTQQLAGLVQGSQSSAEQLRSALNERLAAIQSDNASKLEEMRRTVDEKLHATLEQRLGESFKLVSDRLEQVHKGLGEMQTLAGSVGDLKRVMTNVKSRGTWGEMQLGAIIDNVLTSEQYARNVKTVPGSDEMVEFAIRLPGRADDEPVWLPIDAKYPVEHYQRLMDAQEAADKALMQSTGTAFESSIKLEAKKIYAKYVAPPHTTDFAVLYLPTEGLFAEVMRRPGLVEALQNDCRVMITGPANLAAMLNSLQMGFKTLAIEQRSSEVWGLLGAVKTEFAKFGDVVAATKKSIDAAARKFDEVGVRTRAIQRKLRAVQELPAPEASPVLGLLDVGDADATDLEADAEELSRMP